MAAAGLCRLLTRYDSDNNNEFCRFCIKHRVLEYVGCPNTYGQYSRLLLAFLSFSSAHFQNFLKNGIFLIIMLLVGLLIIDGA